MSRYVIVSKSGRGNERGSVYTISYQVDGLSTIYKADFICLGTLEGRKGKYAFLEGNEYPFIRSNEERQDFIDQIKLFQEGSSYRKAHPITKSNLDTLKDKRKEYERMLNDIDDQIESEENRILKEKVNEYMKDIDYEALKKFEVAFKDLFFDGCRFILLPDSYSVNENIFVYDTQYKKVVKIYEMHNHKILSRDPLDREIKRFLRK